MKKHNKVALITFGISLVVLAAFLWSPIYLAGPDGLEQVLFDLTGNDEWEPETDLSYEGSPFPDYEFAGVENTYLHTWVIGLIGSLMTFVVIFSLTKIMTYKKKKSETDHTIELAQQA